MANVINFALRGLQLLWTVLITALVGNAIHDAFSGNPSIVNYTMFVAVFSLLSLIYLFAATFNEGFAIHPLLPLVVDLLNTLFFLIGGIALAAKLGVHSCGNKTYLKTNGTVNGSDDPSKRCHELQASCAFLWFGFAAYLGSLVFSGLASRGGGGGGFRGGIRGGRPAMSQV